MDGESELVVYAVYVLRKVLGISRFGDLSIRPKGLVLHRSHRFCNQQSTGCDCHRMISALYNASSKYPAGVYNSYLNHIPPRGICQELFSMHLYFAATTFVTSIVNVLLSLYGLNNKYTTIAIRINAATVPAPKTPSVTNMPIWYTQSATT